MIAVEKDTVYKIVQDIGNLLGCSCYSGKGFSSLGAMESLIRDIRDNSDNKPDVIRFLILSDYDPAGLEIAYTIEEQARIIVGTLDMECDVICERIGILPDQLTEEELRNNWYSPKGDMEKWLKDTGGINGQPKGLELDALSPDRIREIFATSLKSYIHSEDYIDDLEDSYIKGRARDAVDKYVDTIVDRIVKEKRDDVRTKDFEILDYVKEGKSYLPDALCYLENDNIDELAKEYLSA